MKKIKQVIILLLAFSLIISCFEDLDDTPISNRDLNDFVWKAMNTYYLYKGDVPNLANDRFTTDEYNSYLNNFSTPEELFENIIYQREIIDRFSWITNDYIALEQFFSGITLNNGMEFGLVRYPQNSSAIFGYVRYVLPNTNAETQGIQRGQIFYAINGIPLNETNYISLLSQNSYTINLATYNDNGTTNTDDDTIIPSTESITLTKFEYTENPIYRTEILVVNGENVGYLMFNGFTANFDTLLNDVFSEFVANNVQNLVLDLRYNPGGSVNTSILLSSMISGNTGEIFSTEQWNDDIHTILDPESLINRFINNDDGVPLNILNLNKVYILTTQSTASASELVINCLDPYINVVHIGTKTTGKYQASITLYDSPDFRRQQANPNHTYALQPLVLKSLNAVGFTDYNEGLIPDIILAENYANLGILGDPSEPLLALALQHIEDTGRIQSQTSEPLEILSDSKELLPFAKGMYIDK